MNLYLNENNGKVYIKEDRNGTILAGPYDEKDEDAIRDKMDKLEEVYKKIEDVCKILKDTSFDNVVSSLFASCLSMQHNTDQASIIRTIRNGLETFEKNARSDLRNETALEWIRRGANANGISFI